MATQTEKLRNNAAPLEIAAAFVMDYLGTGPAGLALLVYGRPSRTGINNIKEAVEVLEAAGVIYKQDNMYYLS